MLAILCSSGPKVFPNCSIFAGQQFRPQENAVLARSCSSSVCKNASEKTTFTVSYLTNSCGLSSIDAVSVHKKLCFKSPKNSDAVLEILREHGFTKDDISKLIIKWPKVLLIKCPNKTLLPKLQFFQSIGVPPPVLAHNLSVCPFVLSLSLKHSIVPTYNYLKTLVGSDERVVAMFSRSPKAFEGRNLAEKDLFSVLRARGVPKSSIVFLVMSEPTMLFISKERLTVYADRVAGMGFDTSKSGFVRALRVFFSMRESTLNRKMDAYRKYGWSESDIRAAFLRYPQCMSLSEKKIMASMEFLVNEFGCKPVDVARCPVVLNSNLEKRIRPRCLVARVLDEKGLKKVKSLASLFTVSEEAFVKRYIVKYEEDVPELLDIYLGKVEYHLKWVSVKK